MHGAILVVEDEVIIRLDIGDFLRDQGYDVLEASSAQQAIDMLKAGAEVAVVFTDVRMPGELDGIDLVCYVRRNHPKIKTIITSGHMQPSELPRELGQLIEKPYRRRKIAELIDEALSSG
jgi:DNA-binding NtrC family response regulator